MCDALHTYVSISSLCPLASSLQRFYKKAAAFVLRAVAKHSPELAQAVVDCGALDSLVICLEEFDPGVKEAAAWALGYIARHNGGMYICIYVHVVSHSQTTIWPPLFGDYVASL